MAAARLVRTTTGEQEFLADVVAGLHSDGASTDRTEARTAQAAAALGVSATAGLGWSRSGLEFTEPGGRVSTRWFATTPAAVGMNRVMGIDAALDRLSAGETTLAQAHDAVRKAIALPPANIFLFAAACAVGAAGLSVIFGVQHWQAVVLIAITSAAGAFLRRAVGAWGGSNFWQAGLAALLAGLVGAIAVNGDLSSSLRLAAVCPCMILVPGPHLLNGSLDLAALRIPLGLARLTFATVTLLAIGAGLLAGLKLGNVDLITDAPGRTIPLWVDAPTAGVVAVCYGVFYSAPVRILVWPFLVGAAVHALRWVALETWHVPAYLGAGLACLVAGAVLVPVSRRLRMPFAAVGFASVVSLMPGLLVFRSLGSLAQLQDATGSQAQQLLVSAVNDATGALLTVLAMAIGFIVPAAVYRRLKGPK